MRKSKLFIAVLACFLMQTVSTFAADKIIPASQLPAAATTFINEYFPGQTISYAKIDKEFRGIKYEVRLNNGVKLDFDKKGKWDKVDCNNSDAPLCYLLFDIHMPKKLSLSLLPAISEELKANSEYYSSK